MILDKLARDIYGLVPLYDDPYFHKHIKDTEAESVCVPFDELQENDPIRFNIIERIAQQAIDSLGILILPADEQPLIGDVITYRNSGGDRMSMVVGINDLSVWKFDGLRIIKRGNQLVLQDIN